VESRLQFVKTVALILGISGTDTEDNEWHLKEKIKKFLYEKGVDEQKIITLIIDEGQKIPDDCLEILREFLNYETNSFKLLQIVIFAQPEFRKNLAARANLLDRVNYLHQLKPLSFRQMKAMIAYRISIASFKPGDQSILTPGGLLAVYFATAGYPRKVVSLCHQIILKMIIRGKSRAGWFLVRSCVRKMNGPILRRLSWVVLGAFVVASFLSGVIYLSSHPISPNSARPINVPAGSDLEKEHFLSSTAEESTKHSRRPEPEFLGAITLKKRMTIWRVLENIYGDSRGEITRQFMLANPQITNLNDTIEGMVIQLPAIPAQGRHKNSIMVSLEGGEDLAGIYYSFIQKNGLGTMPSLQFVSLWHEKTGRQFFIALDKSFATIEAAEETIRQLPPGLAHSARVLAKWQSGTIFFNRRLFKS
jgi:general secretion pathway protein A